jgi:hypothetical protein
MYRNGLIVLVVVAVFAVAGRAQQKPDPLFGEWQGESKCVGTNPYCHDEVVVYRFSPSKTDNAKITWDAYKIIHNERDLMGQLEMTYDREKHAVSVEFPIPRTGERGVWSFTFKGEVMDGTLTLFPGNEVGRKVHVTRMKPGQPDPKNP